MSYFQITTRFESCYGTSSTQGYWVWEVREGLPLSSLGRTFRGKPSGTGTSEYRWLAKLKAKRFARRWKKGYRPGKERTQTITYWL